MSKTFNFDFIGKKKIFFLITAVIMVVMFAGIIIIGPDLDIRFKGGTILAYSYTHEMDHDGVEKIAEELLQQKVSVNVKSSLLGERDSFDITLNDATGVSPETQAKLTDKLMEEYKENEIEALSITSVSPTIGREFFLKCLIAVAFAALLVIIYVAIRFKKISGWSAGVVAILALVHDCIFVFGTFVLFGLPINDSFIAVVLTILGYSVNDTIVIYDRIRENRRLFPAMPVRELVNLSINQTLTRSINTSLTTITTMLVICVVALLMGVSSIVSFALPMCIGLVTGTYSTVCLAGPWWVMWQEYKEKKSKKVFHKK